MSIPPPLPSPTNSSLIMCSLLGRGAPFAIFNFMTVYFVIYSLWIEDVDGRWYMLGFATPTNLLISKRVAFGIVVGSRLRTHSIFNWMSNMLKRILSRFYNWDNNFNGFYECPSLKPEYGLQTPITITTLYVDHYKLILNKQLKWLRLI